MKLLLQTPQVNPPVSPAKQTFYQNESFWVKSVQSGRGEDDNFPVVTSWGDLILEENEMMTLTLS